jgi:NADH-quinone oxidoreductase subunit A
VDLYVPIIALGVLAFVFAAGSVLMAAVTGPKRWNKARLDAYECSRSAAGASR